jgi:hypothetical protein
MPFSPVSEAAAFAVVPEGHGSLAASPPVPDTPRSFAMPGTAAAGSYRAVLLLPFALRTFVPALAGRLAYGLLPLALLFTVSQATGSYATAGLAAAAFGLASITLPAKARLADRRSQRRTLPWLAMACSAALAAAAFTAAPAPVVTLVALAGLAAPPLGPSMRATWGHLTEGTALRERAYAVDSVAEETLYLVGPLVTGLLVALWPARVALLVTAALLLTGTLGMAAAPPSRHRSPAEAAREPGPAHLHGCGGDSGPAPAGYLPRLSGRRGRFASGPGVVVPLRGVLLVVVVLGTAVSMAYTAVAAVAQAHGRPGAAGLIEAAVAAGSVTGGLLWARRRHTRPRMRQMAALLAVLAAGLLAAAVTPGLTAVRAVLGLTALGVVLGLAGTAVAPLYVLAYLAADDLAPPGRRTEAGTWVNVAANAGSAAGAAGAGLLTERLGPATAFLAGAAILAAQGVSLALPRGRPAGDAQLLS